MTKHSLKMTVLFSLLVFSVLTATMVFTFFFTMILYRTGILNGEHRETLLFSFAFVSILIGMILSKLAGKRPIAAIIEISNATKEVAKGNFDIQLNENIRAAEIHTMAHNFNVMIRELASIELLRNDFIENVSHEFKTPISAIEGYATLLQKDNLSEEKKREYTQRILINTKRLSSLTGNILVLSRLENQGTEIKRQHFSLDEQLRETILMFESQWSIKNLDLDIDLDTADYFGNQELLAQVWQNVIGNAIKFVSENGRIRVLLRNKETEIKVYIVDNGIGMNQEISSRVFEKFYQGDASRTGSGNGLGLALAKRIVDLHNGSISVSSREGTGTTFTISLPVSSEERS